MLTLKSDDVVGRSKAFEAIVKGETIPMSSIPESFKVLVKELNSLCLAVIPTGQVVAHVEEPLPVKPEIAAEIAEATSMSDELKVSTFEEETDESGEDIVDPIDEEAVLNKTTNNNE